MNTFTGSMVAIVTPMHEDGSLDLDGMRHLVNFHVQEGTDAIVVVGTTGESPTVDVEEHHELIRLVVNHAAGRIPVIAGTGAEFDGRSHRDDAFCPEGRCQCRAVCCSLLQSADTGRSLPALQGNCRSGGYSGFILYEMLPAVRGGHEQ